MFQPLSFFASSILDDIAEARAPTQAKAFDNSGKISASIDRNNWTEKSGWGRTESNQRGPSRSRASGRTAGGRLKIMKS